MAARQGAEGAATHLGANDDGPHGDDIGSGPHREGKSGSLRPKQTRGGRAGDGAAIISHREQGI